MKQTGKSFAVACLALAFTATGALAGDEKLSFDLKSNALNRNVEVIVQYKVHPTDAHHQRVVDLGGTLQSKMDYIQAGHYTVPPSALKSLSEDPDVAFVTPNRPLKGMMDIPAETVNAAAAVAAGYDGTGIGVAVIDSGIGALTADFEVAKKTSGIVYEAYFIGTSAADLYGHGSHVAGLIGSNGNGSVYTGIVPKANLIILRALDQNGAGTDASVINAINAAISLKNTYNIRVINLSLGRPVFEAAALDPLCQAVEAAWKAGIVVVVAAGNEGRNNSANSWEGTLSSVPSAFSNTRCAASP